MKNEFIIKREDIDKNKWYSVRRRKSDKSGGLTNLGTNAI